MTRKGRHPVLPGTQGHGTAQIRPGKDRGDNQGREATCGQACGPARESEGEIALFEGKKILRP